MSILSVMDLNKKYERFELSNVSFSLEKGTITGFIGRNGACVYRQQFKSFINQ
ncbi:hypothetical protein [Clostridium aromativorans]|uniref:hypothetical protein n=1 Tax=Clostridium aromativorans TaxID=2836848 RepID=UPI002DD9CBD8|nr:hypothetical protein [Clostridium aromativorans]